MWKLKIMIISTLWVKMIWVAGISFHWIPVDAALQKLRFVATLKRQHAQHHRVGAPDGPNLTTLANLQVYHIVRCRCAITVLPLLEEVEARSCRMSFRGPPIGPIGDIRHVLGSLERALESLREFYGL